MCWKDTDFKKIGVTGLAGTIVTLTLLLKQMEEAINRIFEVIEKRSILQRFLYFWTFLTLGTFCLAISVGTLSSFAWSSRYFELTLSEKVFRDIFYLGGMYLLFLFMYKIAPNRPIPVLSAMIGALVSTTLLTQAIRFFSLYVSNFTRYEAIYGALAALPIFLLWLYIIWLITLIGALVTKRIIDGLPKETLEPRNILKLIRQDYMHIIVPFMALMKSYEFFARGESCTAERVSRALGLDSAQVIKAFSKLVAADFIVVRHSKRKSTDEFYPRLAGNHLSFAQLKMALLGDVQAWLMNCGVGEGISEAYEKAMAFFLEGSDKTIADALPLLTTETETSLRLNAKGGKLESNASDAARGSKSSDES